MPNLTWSLVIPTYNRLEILREALECVATQTRPPIEIVIVDSSPDSDKNKEIIEQACTESGQRDQLTYILSKQPSSAIQRNEGIDRCSGDIIIFIDDDTLIYPDFAEIMLQIYEEDNVTEIVGIQAAFADKPFSGNIAGIQRCQPTKRTRFGKLILLMKNTRAYIHWGYFLPYKGSFPALKPIELRKSLNVEYARTLGGGFSSYRREVIKTVRFDPDLLFYATGEDQDASYRASFIGTLLYAPEARAYHCGFPSARPDFYVRLLTKHTNSAFWIQKHNARSLYIKFCYLVLLCWHLPCRLLDDLEERRWTFPRVRGILAAIWFGSRIFLIPASKLSAWYKNFQTKLYETRKHS